jgi:hypothetical protein
MYCLWCTVISFGLSCWENRLRKYAGIPHPSPHPSKQQETIANEKGCASIPSSWTQMDEFSVLMPTSIARNFNPDNIYHNKSELTYSRLFYILTYRLFVTSCRTKGKKAGIKSEPKCMETQFIVERGDVSWTEWFNAAAGHPWGVQESIKVIREHVKTLSSLHANCTTKSNIAILLWNVFFSSKLYLKKET